MILRKLSIAFSFVLLSLSGKAQSVGTIDSLKLKLATETDLRVKGDILYYLGQEYYGLNRDSAVFYLDAAYEIAKHENDLAFQSKVASVLGLLYQYEDPVKSTAFIFEALDLAEQAKDTSQIAFSYNTIGSHYRVQGELDKSIEFYEKSLAIRRLQNDSMSIAVCYNNLGISYMMQAEYDIGLDYWKQSLEIKLALGEELAAASTMANIAIYYKDIDRTYEALEYTNRAIEIEIRQGDYQGTSHSYGLLGDIYLKTENYPKAIESYKKSLAYADSIQSEYEKIEPLAGMAIAYKNMGNYKEAFGTLEYYVLLYKRYNDENIARISSEMQTKFETAKKEKENLLLKTENEKKDLMLDEEAARNALQESNNRYLMAGLILAVALLAVIVIFLRRVRAAKIQVEEQKYLVEEKNKEITDSINYAKRIQAAILPPDSLIKKLLPESFVLYKPKDIVAGDFYWLQQKDNKILIAAADCTGHGVPGAMVSVVCNNALNRAVREYGITDPGKILDKTRDLVIEEFEKSAEEVKDGMDISLCSIDLTNKTLEWSGANNPLWILKKGETEIAEVKANKQPIGKFAGASSFTTHTKTLDYGDSIYIFTDGYQDQFGGEHEKKFKASELKKLLQTIVGRPLEEQKKITNQNFEAWRGNLEQLDDVCLIGIRIV